METENTLPYTFNTTFDTCITKYIDNTQLVQSPYEIKPHRTKLSTNKRDVDIEIYEECLEEFKKLNQPVYLIVSPFPKTDRQGFKRIHPDLETIRHGRHWIACSPIEYTDATTKKIHRWLKKNEGFQVC